MNKLLEALEESLRRTPASRGVLLVILVLLEVYAALRARKKEITL